MSDATDGRRRVSCGPESLLREGMILRVPLLPSFFYDDDFVGRTKVTGVALARRDGVVHAYLNLCRHIPLTLDLGDGEVASADGKYFLCHHHGARYRVDDGTCVYGPCDGDSLIRVDVEVVDGELILILPLSGAPRAG